MSSIAHHLQPRQPTTRHGRLRMRVKRHGFGAGERRRSWWTLLAWGVLVAVLAVLGRDIAARLSPMSLAVPGTPSSRAEATLNTRFGSTIPIAILLRGPQAEVESQGRRLVAELQGIREVQVLSPWNGSISLQSLRPRPGAAFVLVNFVRPQSQAMAVVPQAESIVSRTVGGGVHSYLTGVAVIGRALQEVTLRDTERAEMIALPVLILVLLLVFRSPVAAAVPLLMGGATLAAGHGLMWLASYLTPINSLGVAIAAMMSLALGVDYALLRVSRVRQELAAGAENADAVCSARRAAGRTILSAGATLALAMLAASEVATPGLLGPVAIGVVISALLSVALALTAMPALLRLLGTSINRWEIRLPARRGRRRSAGRAAELAERLIRRPALSAPLIVAAMLAVAAPAGALQMGPPDAAELPASSPARMAVGVVERTIGPGWSAPFVVVASAAHGPITTYQRLNALMRWQKEVAGVPDVAAVLGPGSVAGAHSALARARAAMGSAPGRIAGAQRGVAALRGGLKRAGEGVEELRGGLGRTVAGADSLESGALGARAGARELAAQSGRARAGAARLALQSRRAGHGAGVLASESLRAQRGARLLAREGGGAQAGAVGLQGGLAEVSAGADRLAAGLDESSAGAEHLASSDHELASGAAELAQGMDSLDNKVQTMMGPVDLLAEQLHAWSGWIAGAERASRNLSALSREATQQLEAMNVGHEDPRYLALANTLATIRSLSEGNGLAQLEGIAQRLTQGMEEVIGLPAQLAEMGAD
ncbi:MAG: MMPL family transporter, partial [Solirubrobacteraceae bacterium]